MAWLLTLSLTACAISNQSRVSSAVSAPLSDLNLIQAKIPPILLAARKHPYRMPKDFNCYALSAQIRALDKVLGPDLNITSAEADSDLLERGAEAANDAAINALRHTTESIVPFRSWVRKLTGAERHSDEVAASIRAGIARRAFLKGLWIAHGCQRGLDWLNAARTIDNEMSPAYAVRPTILNPGFKSGCGTPASGTWDEPRALPPD